MEPDDWIDITTVGSSYDVQLSPSTNRQRHRAHSFGEYELEWTNGAPPENKADTNRADGSFQVQEPQRQNSASYRRR